MDLGVSAGLDVVKLDAAITAAEVPRGAAYRLWEDEDLAPQDAFRRAVLLHLMTETPLSTGIESSEAASAAVIDKHQALLESDDPAARDWVRREMLRVGCAVNFAQIRDSQLWRIYRAVAVAATTQGHDKELREAASVGERRLVAGYSKMFLDFAVVFGWQVRSPYTIDQFTWCAYALVEGLSNRAGSTAHHDEIVRPTGLHGEDESWTLFAVGFDALVTEFFEPVS